MPYKPVDTDIKVLVGPLIDDTNFKTREEAIAWNGSGVEFDVVIEKADGTVTTTAITLSAAGTHTWTHTDQGYYTITIPAAGGANYSNNAEGVLTVIGYFTGVLPFRSVAYDIVNKKTYNSLVKGIETFGAGA